MGDSTNEALTRLRSVLNQGDGPLLIVLHDYPDPDCLASAMGLRRLLEAWGLRVEIAHGGGMGRADNKAMAGLLAIDLLLLDQVDVTAYRGAILADTQPDVGNNSLPAEMPVIGVIDHHPISEEGLKRAAFADVRTEFGATSTMMVEYLKAADVVPDAKLATALYLGIMTDTEGLERDASPADIAAYVALLPSVDMGLVAKITRPPLGDEYFAMLQCGLGSAQRRGEAVVARIDPVPEPDWLSEVSELLLRAKGVAWALAIGEHDGTIYLSLRIRPPRKNAGSILIRTVADAGHGGGHALAAGGSIHPGDGQSTADAIDAAVARFLDAVGVSDEPARPLVPQVRDCGAE